MDVQQAIAVAMDPESCSRTELTWALDVLRREVDRMEAHTVEAARLRALSGS